MDETSLVKQPWKKLFLREPKLDVSLPVVFLKKPKSRGKPKKRKKKGPKR